MLWTDWFFKERSSCEICGYDRCKSSLDFHHTDPSQKEYSISDFTVKAFNERNREKALNEIKKCIVLCANCHRELHALDT
jgi:hypothetical protein